MYLQSIPGLNQQVKETSYYQSKIKPTDKELLIDKCNSVINSIVDGNRHNWYLDDFEAVAIPSSILKELLGNNTERNGHKEYFNIINLLIEVGMITVDYRYISTAMADIENKKRISKGLRPVITPISHKLNLPPLAKSNGIVKVGVLRPSTENKLLKIRLREYEKYYKDPFHKTIMDNIFNLHFESDKAQDTLIKIQIESRVKLRELSEQNNTTKRALKKEKKQRNKIQQKLNYYESVFNELIKMNGYRSPRQYFLNDSFYYTVSKVVNRLYYFYTTIPREYRKCLRHKDGTTLIERDLSNSQPLNLVCNFIKFDRNLKSKDIDISKQINRNNKEKKSNNSICGIIAHLDTEKKELLNDVLNGNFYKKIADYSLSINDQVFARKFHKNYSAFKQDILGNGLYGKLRAKSNVLKAEKYLMAVYPNFMEWIRQIKINDGYKAVPIMAQRIESNIFITEFFNKINFFAVSVHDSIITTEENMNEAVQILTDNILKEFPFLKDYNTKNLFK